MKLSFLVSDEVRKHRSGDLQDIPIAKGGMLKYYVDEANRWPELDEQLPRGAWDEVSEGIRRLARAHNIPLRGVKTGPPGPRPPVRLCPVYGCRPTQAGFDHIVINMDDASWLTVAHEVAHTYCTSFLSPDQRGYGFHNSVHARVVDRFAAWIVAQGWHKGTLAHELALKENKRSSNRERF
jgi:hypothetical protein